MRSKDAHLLRDTFGGIRTAAENVNSRISY
jgi:hypothetical protein